MKPPQESKSGTAGLHSRILLNIRDLMVISKLSPDTEEEGDFKIHSETRGIAIGITIAKPMASPKRRKWQTNILDGY